MKQTVRLVLVLMLAVSLLCGSVQAVGETYTFDDVDLEVTLPEEDYYVLLQDMDPEDPVLLYLGRTPEEINEVLKPNHVILQAFYPDRSENFLVVVIEGEEYQEVFNYDVLSRLERELMTAQAKKLMEDHKVEVTGDVAWEEVEGVPYVVMELARDDTWTYQYLTVYNGRAVQICGALTSSEEPTDEIREQVRRLAEGVRFTRRLPTPQSVLDSYSEDGEEAPWSWSKLLTVVAGIVGVAVFSSIFAANARKSRMQFQTIIEGENKNQSIDDISTENVKGTGGEEP